MVAALLPVNAGHFERALVAAFEHPAEIGEGVAEISGIKYARPLNQSVAPWLVYEYGLGMISMFFDSYEDLIDDGRPWMRLRGTPEALTTGLSWIIYPDAVLEDQRLNRRRWHLYQVGMGAVPDAEAEVEILTRAEYLAGIADPARSEMFRGFHGYDVRAMEFSNFRFGQCLIGDDSGVRLPGGQVKWSHGREHELQSDTDGQDWSLLDIDFQNGSADPDAYATWETPGLTWETADLSWVESPGAQIGEPITWTMQFTWEMPGLTWGGVSDAKALRAYILARKQTYVGFFDQGGDPLGYCLIVLPIVDVTGEVGLPGDYAWLRYTALTEFGDGYLKKVASAAIIINGRAAAGIKPYQRWLKPSEIVFPEGEVKLGQASFDHQFMATVRDRIIITLGIS